MNAKVERLAAQVEALSIEALLQGAWMLALDKHFDLAEGFAAKAIEKINMARLLKPQAKS